MKKPITALATLIELEHYSTLVIQAMDLGIIVPNGKTPGSAEPPSFDRNLFRIKRAGDL